MKDAPTIAILADFPLWLVTDIIEKPQGHFAVWLQALFGSTDLPADWQIHWIVLNRRIAQYSLVTRKNHHFHLIGQGSRMLGVASAYAIDRVRISQVIRRIKPDLVHAWGTETPYALAGTDFNGRRLLSMQGILTAYCKRSPMPLFARLQQWWERTALRCYPHVTVESPWGRERLLEIVPDARIELIEYGVEPFVMRIEKQLDRQPCCFYAGSLCELKGSDILIECFSRPELQHVQLRIAGDGDPAFVEQLRERSGANITYLGRLDREQMAAELARTWCVVHPTLADTSPNIVKEARCCGTPVISTPEGGQTQYIEEGKSGFICPVHDIQSMVNAVLAVTQSPEKSLEMGAFGQSVCREQLDPDLTARKLTRLYKRLLNDPT